MRLIPPRGTSPRSANFSFISAAVCLLFKIFCEDNKFLDLFLYFLHPFVLKHLRIFVTVMRSNFTTFFHERKLEQKFINFVLLALFSMLETNIIYIILYLHSRNDISALRLWR